MIRTRGFAAQTHRLVDGERRSVLVRGSRRSQHKIALRRDSHVIAVFRYQRVAQSVNARLDQLLAIIFDGIWQTNCPDEGTLRQLRENDTKSLRRIRFSGNGFAYPEVTQRAAGPGDANSGLRERGSNWGSKLFGRLLIERFRFVTLRAGFSRGKYEKGKKEIMATAVDYGTGAIYRRVQARKEVAKDGEWFTLTVLAHGRHGLERFTSDAATATASPMPARFRSV